MNSGIVIDLTYFTDKINYLFSLPADQLVLAFLANVGWMPVAIIFIWGAFQLWLDYIQGIWGSQQKFILLAIDIPRNNEQSPKAIENMFTYFLGAHQTFNLFETYWQGKFQLCFTFEIVSIEGYTQFLVHTPEAFRDLVEAAVYSQYPDAEITEVEDYTKDMPSNFPDEDWDLWGSEFIQVKDWVYPIKTYRAFEHQLGRPEMTYRDPISSLMSLCSSMGKGEQLWFQIVAKPTDFDWVKKGEKEIKKLFKEEVPPDQDFFDKILDSFSGFLDSAASMVFSIFGEEAAAPEKKTDALSMLLLKPKEKKQVEMIQEKISKGGFLSKLRFIYIAKKEVMSKPKGVNGFVGYIKQFADLDLNNFKPDTKVTGTSVSYFFTQYRLAQRKTNIIKAYKGRSSWRGRNPGILNIEELATLWHFPIESVTKAPMLQIAPGKKSEPPASLPIEESYVSGQEQPLDEIFAEVLGKRSAAKASNGDADTRKAPVIKTGMALTEDDIFVMPKTKPKKEASVPRSTPPGNLPFA